MTPRESATETRLTRAVRRAGALTFKLAPTTAGIPDRIVVWPIGVVDFVEVKAEDGRLSPIQRRRISDLRENGASVHVVYGHDGVDDYVSERIADLDLPLAR